MSQPTTYRDVKAEVLRRIRARVWPPGALIPGEESLAREFDCARSTVNRALRELAETGLLDRRRKAGTRVSLNPVRRATLEIPVIRQEIEASGATHRHMLLECRVAEAPLAVRARLGLEDSLPLLQMQTLHLADDRPYLLEDRWVNPDAVPGILDAPLDRISANEWLVQNAALTYGDIEFSAVAAGPAGEALACAADAALFMVERTTWQGVQPITYVRLLYAPGYRMKTVI
ncbi:MAG: GntR family transcriptional regulator [Pseudomonadota bacterium]